MKIKNYVHLLLLTLCPILSNAQWNMVRFDQHHTFSKAFTVNTNTAFLIGVDPVNTKFFILRTNTSGTVWDSISFDSSINTHELKDIYFLDANTGFVGGLKNNKQVLLKTVDNGTTWVDITPDPNAPNGISSIHFVNALNGFATDGWGNLYSTINGGVLWTILPIPYLISDLYFTDMNNGYACGSFWWSAGAVISKTSDGGQTWHTLLNMAVPSLFGGSFYKEDFINASTGFTSLGNTNKIFKTLDAGTTWDTIFGPSPIITDFDFISADTGHVLSSAGEIFATVDGGQNWTLEYATSFGFYGSVSLYSLSFVGETGFVGGSNGLIKRHSVIVTDIKEEHQYGIFNAYPNPLIYSHDLSIKILETIDYGNIQITNAVGQIIFQKELHHLNNNSTVTLSDIILPVGIYYLTLNSREKRSTEKLMIMN